MPEFSIDTCLALCLQAQNSQGTAQDQALQRLYQALQALQGTGSYPCESLAQPAVAAHSSSSSPACSEAVMILDLTGYLTGWSSAAEHMFGYVAQEAIGRHILFLYAEDDGDIAELFLEHGSSVMDVRRRKKSGEVFWASLSLSTCYGPDTGDDHGEPIGLAVHMAEIKDRLSDEEKLRLHARIIEDSDQGILITDAHERIVSINSSFTRITGYSPAEAIGETPDLLRSGLHTADFRAEVRAAMRGSGPWHGEIVGRRKNGELFPQSVTISVVRNDEGDIGHVFSIFSDISAHKEAEARLQRIANYDSLTGLPNRSLLNKLVGQALTVAKRNNDYGALMVIDLSRYTVINDTLGYDIGNDVLCRIGRQFQGALRDDDILAKIDGEKFAVALLNIEKREHAGIVAKKLLATLDAPIVVDTHALHIGASIGIAVYPEDGQETTALLRYADVAMKRVQQSGDTGFLFYSADMNQRAKEHLRIESMLRKALAGGELCLHYQPKVSLRSGVIVGAEALARWHHPEEGTISPVVFISIAEETGLIMELGAWVLDEACRQLRQWRDDGFTVPPVAVNLSVRQFDHNLPARVQAVLRKYDIPPEQIRLELTESLLVRGAENVIPIMNELVAMGVALALDDFGTGYSSLAYLKKFPISTLKIDRSFVIGLPDEENDCAIARAIVTMGQQLHQEIVAEGVERPEQMAFLRNLGCDQLQGYLFSPAVPAQDFVRMVADGKRLALPPQANR